MIRSKSSSYRYHLFSICLNSSPPFFLPPSLPPSLPPYLQDKPTEVDQEVERDVLGLGEGDVVWREGGTEEGREGGLEVVKE